MKDHLPSFSEKSGGAAEPFPAGILPGAGTVPAKPTARRWLAGFPPDRRSCHGFTVSFPLCNPLSFLLVAKNCF